MKRLIICCDGTWQDAGCTFPTNVAKIAASIKPVANNGTIQSVYYGAGIGTNGIWNKIFGGGLGIGIDFSIKDAYRFICLNYKPGDELYMFGFSRGSYLVRSLAGLIYNSGLLRPEHLDKLDCKGCEINAYQLYRNRNDDFKPGSEIAKKFRFKFCVNDPYCIGDNQGRVPIRLLACWDTVGSLGLPPIGIFNIKAFYLPWLIKRFPGKYRFHDIRLSKIIVNALHAVSIDERRKVFNVTLMAKDDEKMDSNGNVRTVTGEIQKIRQVWFPGDHPSVGGGVKALQGLSDATLYWVIEQTEQLDLGLEFDLSRIPYKPDPGKFDYKTSFSKIDWLNLLGLIWRKLNDETHFDTDIHRSAKLRWRDCDKYRPETLKEKFEKEMNMWKGREKVNF